MWIVIECFDVSFPSIVTNEEGFPIIFESEEEANLEAGECQKGIIVKIG